MALRTSPDAVKDILVEYQDGLSITPFLTPANALTDWLVTQDEDDVLTDALLEQIECHLAAHFYKAHYDKQYTSKSTGAASGSFQGQTGMILSSTDYGQTAMLLDVTNVLAQRSKDAEEGKPNKMEVTWGGDADQSPEYPYPWPLLNTDSE